jgi:hypothetical protein
LLLSVLATLIAVAGTSVASANDHVKNGTDSFVDSIDCTGNLYNITITFNSVSHESNGKATFTANGDFVATPSLPDRRRRVTSPTGEISTRTPTAPLRGTPRYTSTASTPTARISVSTSRGSSKQLPTARSSRTVSTTPALGRAGSSKRVGQPSGVQPSVNGGRGDPNAVPADPAPGPSSSL